MKTSALGEMTRWMQRMPMRGIHRRTRESAADLESLTREEARRRARSKPGLFASLSPEAREYLRNYDGPEIMGPPR